MKLFFPYTKEELNKIGNTIVYLTQYIKPLSKTKLLKLLYLIEETSVKKFGLPFLNLKFFVWKLGPVAKDIFIDLSASEPVLLDDYIKREEKDGNTFIFPRVRFSDDEFTDNEIQILELVVEKFKNSKAEELVRLTHQKHSLWYEAAKSEGVLEYLENEMLNNTDIEIDFAKLLEDDKERYEMYHDQKEFLEASRSLKL